MAKRRSRRILGTLRLVREGTVPAPDGHPDLSNAIVSARDVYVLMAPLAEREEVECMWMVPLNARHATIFRDPVVISRGILNSALVHAREVFRPAIVAGAMAIILVHNHPSGDPDPSAEDRQITEMLKHAGEHIGIMLLDHIIVGRGRFMSFADSGLL